jgi:surface antigen
MSWRQVFTLRMLAVMSALVLQACGSAPAPRLSAGGPAGAQYPGIACAPFARELSGIALYGDAASWWDQASGQYRRDNRPILGAALVFRREQRLPAGHVSVVSRLLGPRQIQVTQANWVPGQLDEDQLVVDVSERNDWTLVRVWYPPVNQLGAHSYPAYGFIDPPIATTRDDIARTTPIAASVSLESSRGRPPPRARQIAQGHG